MMAVLHFFCDSFAIHYQVACLHFIMALVVTTLCMFKYDFNFN